MSALGMMTTITVVATIVEDITVEWGTEPGKGSASTTTSTNTAGRLAMGRGVSSCEGFEWIWLRLRGNSGCCGALRKSGRGRGTGVYSALCAEDGTEESVQRTRHQDKVGGGLLFL